MSIFNTQNRSYHTERNCFFDEPVDIARYEKVKYPQFEKLTEKQLSFFWRPEEIDLSRDSKDYRALTKHEQHIFISNLKRQILLDSVQGRAPTMAFTPICSLPELETWIQTWTFFETIHSRSYTYIIRNIYPNPSQVFDGMLEIQEIVDCAKDISKYYDDLLTQTAITHGARPWCPVNNKEAYKTKKALWLCLNAVNALEGVRFYVSFACSWNFAELKKMEGNAKIIKFIARDENLHLASTQQLLKILPKEDPDFLKISNECQEEVVKIFEDVVNQEKKWAQYLFAEGSIIGLNETLLSNYVEWIAQKRMTAIGLPTIFNVKNNPLPWTSKWIAGSEVQVAPQEVELSSYTIGEIKQDVSNDTFKGIKL